MKHTAKKSESRKAGWFGPYSYGRVLIYALIVLCLMVAVVEISDWMGWNHGTSSIGLV